MLLEIDDILHYIVILFLFFVHMTKYMTK